MNKNATITSSRELNKLFWETFIHLPKKKIRDYEGSGFTYPTDTRCAWNDFKDALAKSGIISDRLNDTAELK